MQNEQTPLNLERTFDNYFGAPAYFGVNNTRPDNCATSTIVHNHSNNYRPTSPHLIQAQKLNISTQNITQRNTAISPPRRSIQVEDPRLLNKVGVNFVQTTKSLAPDLSHRSTYRAPSLRTNGRSLSARDSEEDFKLKAMKSQGAAVSVKRLLPVTPIPRLSAIGGRHHNRLSFDVSSGSELLERQLQDTLVVNESLFQRNKDKLPQEGQQRFTKRSQSPNVTEARAISISPPHQQALSSPKRVVTEVGQPKQLLQGCSRRLNFQRLCNQKSLMGQENSRPPVKSNSSFSNSFDSSTVYCRPSINLAATRANSTASDNADCDMHLNTVKTPHANSTGSLQVENNAQPMKQKRSMAELYTSSKTRTNTLTPNGKSSTAKQGHNKAIKKTSQSGISTSAQGIINFCVENAKGDISTRVINRMMNRREDFSTFINNLSTKQYNEFANSLREFFASVVQHLHSTDKICELSSAYGADQVSRRNLGFKADYFSTLANELTTECVFLDGATHASTEVIQAWTELTQLLFTSVRDGYYERVRHLRKNSHCFKSMHSQQSQSSDVSNEETCSTPKQTDSTHFN